MSRITRQMRRELERRRSKQLGRIADVESVGASASVVEPNAASWRDEARSHAQENMREQYASVDAMELVADGKPLPRLAKTADVAHILGVHPKTVDRLRRTDGLPCLRIGGSVRFDISDVLRWASARKEGV